MNKIKAKMAHIKLMINSSYQEYEPEAALQITEKGIEYLKEINKMQNEYWTLHQKLKTIEYRKHQIKKIWD